MNAQGQAILELKRGEFLDYETTPSVVINVTATDAGGLKKVQAFTIGVTNINDRPTDITLTSAGVDENAATGTVVGTLGATDQDASSTLTYALVTGNGPTTPITAWSRLSATTSK